MILVAEAGTQILYLLHAHLERTNRNRFVTNNNIDVRKGVIIIIIFYFMPSMHLITDKNETLFCVCK